MLDRIAMQQDSPEVQWSQEEAKQAQLQLHALQALIKELAGNCMCPIEHSLMHDPVFAADGHTYERRAIERWLAFHNTSPLTGQTLKHRSVTPNFLANAMACSLRACSRRNAATGFGLDLVEEQTVSDMACGLGTPCEQQDEPVQEQDEPLQQQDELLHNHAAQSVAGLLTFPWDLEELLQRELDEPLESYASISSSGEVSFQAGRVNEVEIETPRGPQWRPFVARWPNDFMALSQEHRGGLQNDLGTLSVQHNSDVALRMLQWRSFALRFGR